MTIGNSIYKLCGDASRKKFSRSVHWIRKTKCWRSRIPTVGILDRCHYWNLKISILHCITIKSRPQNISMKINILTERFIVGLLAKKFPPWEFLCIEDQYHYNKQFQTCLPICHKRSWPSTRSNNSIVWLKWKYFAAGVQIPTVGIWSFDKQGTWIIWIIFALFKWYYCSSRSIHLT